MRSSPSKPDVSQVRALTFDVFGTTVNWRSGVAAEARRIGALSGVEDAAWVVASGCTEEPRRPGDPQGAAAGSVGVRGGRQTLASGL